MDTDVRFSSQLARVRGASRATGIPCYQFIETRADYALPFPPLDEARGLDLSDRIVTFDADAKAAMAADGMPEAKIEIIGQPYLEACHHRLRLTVPAARARALLVTQPVAKHHGRRLGCDETTFPEARLDAWQMAERGWGTRDVIIHPDED